MAVTEVQWRSTIPSIDSKDISPSLGVRRCLFGPVDHTEIRTNLQREMKSMVEDGIRRWNFDFDRETPLKGRYLWQKLPRNDVSSSSITLNSRNFNKRDSNYTRNANVELNSSATTTTTTSSTTSNTSCGKSTIQASKKTGQNPRKRVAINTITEFLKQKKPRSCTEHGKDSPSLRRQTRSSNKRQMRLDKFLN